MKTSFDVPAQLLAELRAVARERGTTSKSLVEEALRELIERHRRPSPYTLPDKSVAGNGLSDQFRDATWADVRDAAYGMPSSR